MRNQKGSSTGLLILLGALLIPVLVAAAYVLQTRETSAASSCPPENIRTERASQSLARISFDTTCTTKATVYCAIGRDGVQFSCGQDTVASTNHVIETSGVTLSSDTPYFIFIDTGLDKRTLGYIQANPIDATVGIDFEAFDDNASGVTSREDGYDVSLDINQDGIVNGMDRSEFYPEYK